MSSAEKVYIIGIGENGPEGLTAAARQLIERAELLIGEPQTRIDRHKNFGNRRRTRSTNAFSGPSLGYHLTAGGVFFHG